MKNSKREDILFGLAAFLVVVGVLLLLDRYLSARWPVQAALLVFAFAGTVTAPRGWWYRTAVLWLVVFAVFAFWIWKKNSASPVWFGLVWTALAGAGAIVGQRQHETWLKEKGAATCPRCGTLLKYAGERYGGYAESSAGGYGTRTSNYRSAYECSKCGYETR